MLSIVTIKEGIVTITNYIVLSHKLCMAIGRKVDVSLVVIDDRLPLIVALFVTTMAFLLSETPEPGGSIR